jgi:hypothetical protein
MPSDTSPPASLTCLMQLVNTGDDDYPVLVGLAPAQLLDKISEAPAHESGESNAKISESVRPNMALWQRGLDDSRVRSIKKTFSQARGQIMPNPVLLAVTQKAHEHMNKADKHGVWTISFPELQTPPLWILDGQHRIRGLAASDRPHNPVPFVLLANVTGEKLYKPAVLAKIFAQVSTEATPLTNVHAESLSFAFQLGNYSPDLDKRGSRDSSMKATKWLCEDSERLWDRITFDPEEPDSKEAFGWTNKEWVELFAKNFFNIAKFEVAPDTLARILDKALDAAYRSLSNPDNTALFGSSGPDGYGRKPIQVGFVSAALKFLANDQDNLATDWPPLIKALRFGEADWDLRALEHGGVDGGRAPAIATNMMLEGFLKGHFPGRSTFSAWLNGDVETHLDVTLSVPDPNGGPRQDPTDPRICADFAAGPTPSVVESQVAPKDRTHITIEATPNLSGFALTDLHAGPDDPGIRGSKGEHFGRDLGARLREKDGTKTLRIKTNLYGGPERTLDVSITYE